MQSQDASTKEVATATGRWGLMGTIEPQLMGTMEPQTLKRRCRLPWNPIHFRCRHTRGHSRRCRLNKRALSISLGHACRSEPEDAEQPWQLLQASSGKHLCCRQST